MQSSVDQPRPRAGQGCVRWSTCRGEGGVAAMSSVPRRQCEILSFQKLQIIVICPVFQFEVFGWFCFLVFFLIVITAFRFSLCL